MEKNTCKTKAEEYYSPQTKVIQISVSSSLLSISDPSGVVPPMNPEEE